VTNPGAHGPFLIVCDHAGRAVPARLGRLGLAAAAFEAHIAWDIGALGLASLLAERLGACLIAQSYSRLVIDCNRAPGHPQSVAPVSDGVAIPGNADLSAEDLAARVAAIHAPYHDRIAAEIADREARGLTTVLVCQHSFTPVMAGVSRPWHVGVLHMGDSPVSHAMLGLLEREPGLVVGDNEPYAMDSIDYTAPRHALAPGHDMLELEVRQDLIAEAAGQARFAELLAPLIAQAGQALPNMVR
jgi:predicted N-formylglutamate amidohydrolase